MAMLASVGDARVFLGGSGAPLAEVSKEIGLKPVYQTEYKINGGDAALEVYAGDLDPAVAASRLQSGLRARQLNASVSAGERGAMGVVTTQDELTRMVLVPTGPGKVIVYAVRQSWDAVKQFRAAAATGQAPDAKLPYIMPYPGSRLIYHVEDQKTKSTFAVFLADGVPQTVRDYFAQALPQNGWEVMGAPSSAMFRRGPLNCFISVQRKESTAELTITVMVRHSSL